jgi:hypothetical protein
MKTEFLGMGLLLVSTLLGCGGSVENSGGSGTGSPAPSTSSSSPGSPRPSPPYPGPTTPTPVAAWQQTANGCGEIFVYIQDTSEQRFLTVEADAKELQIPALGDTVTVQLGTKDGRPSASVAVDAFPRSIAEAPYCTDVFTAHAPPARSLANEGSVTFTRTSSPPAGDPYTITISFKGVVLRGSDGVTREAVPDATYTGVRVGWFAG